MQMKENICSIPINDIFEPKDGCPFCRMRDMLEDRMATYITGAAMMEPDVRIETNKLGFCKTHFDMILERGSRLSVALILESLLTEVRNDVMDPNPKKSLANAKRRQESCFICENTDKNMKHLCATVVKMWQSDPDFRKLYSEQSHICANHYSLIMEAAAKMPGKYRKEFSKVTWDLTDKYMEDLRADVTKFCRMFDYRNAGGEMGTAKDSIERSIEYLTGRKVTTTTQTQGKNR